MNACPSCHRRFVPTQDVCPLDDTPLVPSAGELPANVGKQLGPYQLIGLLGEGGMGNIYVGRHAVLGRYVAIKMLRPELATRKDNVARFFQEAITINQLEHPNIVESLDLVEGVIDGAYCVLELLEGPDLRTRLSRGPLSLDSAIRIGTQLADALGKVHAIGVVHRDLKPENLILIERDGRDDFVKLIDFGVAQIGYQGGAMVGTAAYMAPEQAVRGATVDRRADIYSLGIILFEMVTGRHPFPSSTDSEYLIHHADTKPPRPRKHDARCPAALETVILKCIEKEPAARYASADQLAVALRTIDLHASGRRSWIAAGIAVVGATAAAALLVPELLGDGPASAQSPAVAAEAADASSAEVAPETVIGPTDPAVAHPAIASAEPPRDTVQADGSGEPTDDPARKLVDIGVESTPAGAAVYRASETIALGVTPFTVALPSSSKPVQLRFEKAGYQPKTVEVQLEIDLEIEVSLSRQREAVAAKRGVTLRKPEAPAAGKNPQTVQREGVLDPFADP
jgi:eukaryotic-like serine/threonine-protein kinase